MTTGLVSTPRTPKIFQGPAQTLKQASTLVRILELDKACPITSPSPIILERRQRFIETLASIGTLGREDAPDIGELKEKILALLNGTTPTGLPLVGYPTKVIAIYAAQFDNPASIEDLQKCARRIGKDAYALVAPAYSCSSRSAEGPALLVSYPRPSIKSPGQPKLPNYVMKWAPWNEICSHRIYETISRLFGPGDQYFNFITPRAIGLSFEKKIYQEMDRQTTELGAIIVGDLENAFGRILSSTPDSRRAKGKDILIMEKIKGANFFDFVKSKYKFLPPAFKEKLFTRLGRLALLDLFLGNNDRLLLSLYDQSKKCYELEDYASNLANIVIVWAEGSKEPPAVYTIDNGLDGVLIDNPEYRGKYLEYLVALQKDPTMIHRLTSAVMGAMKNSIEDLLGEDLEPGEDIDSLREHVDLFCDDLEAIGPTAIKQGLREMYASMKQTIVPRWHGQEGVPIRTFLKDNYPAMDQAITERFNTTLAARK